MIYRGDYWQCGYVIPKGGIDELRRQGLEAFREIVAEIAPFLQDRVAELQGLGRRQAADRHGRPPARAGTGPGLLCIGDAAHAMSPVGGVGINLAIQDAVATANLLADPLKRGTPTSDDLQEVQTRRELPTRVTQRLQLLIQNRVIGRVIGSNAKLGVPWPLKLLRRFPYLRRIPAPDRHRISARTCADTRHVHFVGQAFVSRDIRA